MPRRFAARLVDLRQRALVVRAHVLAEGERSIGKVGDANTIGLDLKVVSNARSDPT